MANRVTLREKLMRLIIEQQGLCFYCNCQMRPTPRGCGSTPTLDHLHPRSLGGRTYWDDNLVAACYKCNNQKGSMLIAEFLTSAYLQAKRRSVPGS